MSNKQKTIKLSRAIDMDKSEQGKLVYLYKIIQVTDSLDYHVNDFISFATANELCEAKDWKVTIV